MDIIEEVSQSWGWVGINPVEVVGENEFGNLMIKDAQGRYWRLCPEDCYCKVVANNRSELDTLSRDQDFLHDWHMSALVSLANDRFGPLPEGMKYCLKIPGILGGEYGGQNIATIRLVELIRLSGYIAHQIESLPDGAQIRLQVIE